MPKPGFLGWAYVSGSSATILTGSSTTLESGSVVFYSGSSTISGSDNFVYNYSSNDLFLTGNLYLSDADASAPGEGGFLRLASDDGAAMASGHRLGVVEFAGAEDTSNTITVGARIEALCDTTWSASENGASLLFYTTDANASQSQVLKLTSDKQAAFSGRIVESLSVTDNDAQHNTLSAAEIKGGIVVHTSVTDEGTVTTDTASNIISGVPLSADGDCVKVYYINDGDQDLVFAGGTNVTVADTGTLCLGDEGVVLIFRRTGAAAVTMYLIGGDAAGE